MKKQLVSKISAGLLVSSLVLSGASLASAKGPDQSHGKPVTVTTKSPGKTATKGHSTTKGTIKSSVGKSLEKQLNSSEYSINKIINAVNSYFKVESDGTTDKVLTKKAASDAYNSFKGKLNSELNKLRAVDKQLANYKKNKKVSADELAVLAEKSKTLQALAANEITQVQTLATQAAANKPTTTTTTGTTSGTTTQTGDSDDNQGTETTTTQPDDNGEQQGTTTSGTTSESDNSGTQTTGDSSQTTTTGDTTESANTAD
ncbi:hypothetical protein [Bacillus sp. JJ1764]|uniref:hypothetical protein n=1 Tax=Bacillus sp. JJ1764 TaxID=3122964 RepID=UPI002FFFC422